MNSPNKPNYLDTARKKEIEEAAEQLRSIVAKKQYQLWPSEQRSDIQLLDPDGACRVIGYKYIEQQGLCRQPFSLRGEKIPTAGQVDTRSETITISAELPEPIKRFTTLHEVAHVLIHPDNITLHRDSPLGGDNNSRSPRPLMEAEADYFAACYLLPRGLVIREFFGRFDQVPFEMDDRWAQALCPSDPNSLIRPNEDELTRETVMANALVKGLQSLAKYFKVSTSTMAIRLKELKLIQWP